jgi:hypothetical protein
MLWLILEAGAAFFILVLIVWWTMFSGRKNTARRAPATKTSPNSTATPAKSDADTENGHR